MGQPLFERSKSGVKLTEFGEFCYPYILNVIKSYESMKNSCAKKNEKSLLIGATRVFSSLLGKRKKLTNSLLIFLTEFLCNMLKDDLCASLQWSESHEFYKFQRNDPAAYETTYFLSIKQENKKSNRYPVCALQRAVKYPDPMWN